MKSLVEISTSSLNLDPPCPTIYRIFLMMIRPTSDINAKGKLQQLKRWVGVLTQQDCMRQMESGLETIGTLYQIQQKAYPNTLFVQRATS